MVSEQKICLDINLGYVHEEFFTTGKPPMAGVCVSCWGYVDIYSSCLGVSQGSAENNISLLLNPKSVRFLLY